MGRTSRLGFHSVVSSLVVHLLHVISVSMTEIKYMVLIQTLGMAHSLMNILLSTVICNFAITY